MPAEGERHEGCALADPLGDHGHDLDLAAFGAKDPDLMPVIDHGIVRVGRIDLDEHVMLQLGQPRIGRRPVDAALILTQPSRGHGQSAVSGKSVSDRVELVVDSTFKKQTASTTIY